MVDRRSNGSNGSNGNNGNSSTVIRWSYRVANAIDVDISKMERYCPCIIVNTAPYVHELNNGISKLTSRRVGLFDSIHSERTGSGRSSIAGFLYSFGHFILKNLYHRTSNFVGLTLTACRSNVEFTPAGLLRKSKKQNKSEARFVQTNRPHHHHVKIYTSKFDLDRRAPQHSDPAIPQYEEPLEQRNPSTVRRACRPFAPPNSFETSSLLHC
jgi:hypothetical protein